MLSLACLSPFVWQKSLWDTIKNRREGVKGATPMRKLTDQPLKMSANKTFQVSRKPQYRREKPRSPLASLNEGKAVRERSLSKHGPVEDCSRKSDGQKALNSTQSRQSLALSDQENIYHVQRSPPIEVLVSAGKPLDCGGISVSPDNLAVKPENKDLTKILNKTLSPIGTPERLKKFMPHVFTDSPLSFAAKPVANADDTDSVLPGAPVLSLKDALAIIDSDLTHISASPHDKSSSCGFSDSLESVGGNHGCGPDGNVLNVLPDSPQGSESSEQRLTFFVSKKSEVVVSEPDKATERVKKTSFTSATVTKSKAPVDATSSSGRKIKKSRRKLLEKTLELSDGNSRCESGEGTPSLPVIDLDTDTNEWQSCRTDRSPCDEKHHAQNLSPLSLAPQLDDLPPTVTFPLTSPSMAPAHFSFSVASPSPVFSAPISSMVTSPPPLGSSFPLHLSLASSPKVYEPSPPVSQPIRIQDDSFPIQMAVKSKKRKSEEFLKSDGKTEDAGKTERVKRSRVVPGKPGTSQSVQERIASERQQRTSGGFMSGCCFTVKLQKQVQISTRHNKQTLYRLRRRALKVSTSSHFHLKRNEYPPPPTRFSALSDNILKDCPICCSYPDEEIKLQTQLQRYKTMHIFFLLGNTLKH